MNDMNKDTKPYHDAVLILLTMMISLVALALLLLYTKQINVKEMLDIFRPPIGYLGAALLVALNIKSPLNKTESGDINIESDTKEKSNE